MPLVKAVVPYYNPCLSQYSKNLSLSDCNDNKITVREAEIRSEINKRTNRNRSGEGNTLGERQRGLHTPIDTSKSGHREKQVGRQEGESLTRKNERIEEQRGVEHCVTAENIVTHSTIDSGIPLASESSKGLSLEKKSEPKDPCSTPSADVKALLTPEDLRSDGSATSGSFFAQSADPENKNVDRTSNTFPSGVSDEVVAVVSEKFSDEVSDKFVNEISDTFVSTVSEELVDEIFHARLLAILKQLADLATASDSLFSELVKESDQILTRTVRLAERAVAVWRNIGEEPNERGVVTGGEGGRLQRSRGKARCAGRPAVISEKVCGATGIELETGGSNTGTFVETESGEEERSQFRNWLDEGESIRNESGECSGIRNLFSPETRPEMVRNLYRLADINPCEFIRQLDAHWSEAESERCTFSPIIVSLASDELFQLPTTKEVRVTKQPIIKRKKTLRSPVVTPREQLVTRPKSMPVLPSKCTTTVLNVCLYSLEADDNTTPRGSNTDLSINQSSYMHSGDCGLCGRYSEDPGYVSCTDCLARSYPSELSRNKCLSRFAPIEINFGEVDIDMMSNSLGSPTGSGVINGGDRAGRRKHDSRVEGYAPKGESKRRSGGIKGSDRELERRESWTTAFKRSIRSLFNLSRSRPDLWVEPVEGQEASGGRGRKNKRAGERENKETGVVRSQSLPRINKTTEGKSSVSRVKSTSVEDQLHIQPKISNQSQALLQSVLSREQQKATVKKSGGTRMGRSLSALPSKSSSSDASAKSYPGVASRPLSMEVGVPVFSQSGQLIGTSSFMDSSAGSLSSDSTLVDERGSGRVVHVDVPGPYNSARLRNHQVKRLADTSGEQSSSGHWSAGSSIATDRHSSDSESLRLSYPHQGSALLPSSRASLVSLEELRRYSGRSPVNGAISGGQQCNNCGAVAAVRQNTACQVCGAQNWRAPSAGNCFSTFRGSNSSCSGSTQSSTSAVNNWIEANLKYSGKPSISSTSSPMGGDVARIRGGGTDSDSDDSDEALEQLTDTRNPAALQRIRSIKRRRQVETEDDNDDRKRSHAEKKSGLERKGTLLGRLRKISRSFRGRNSPLSKDEGGASTDEACLTPQLPRSKAMEIARLTALAERLAASKQNGLPGDIEVKIIEKNLDNRRPTASKVNRTKSNQPFEQPTGAATYYRYPSCDSGLPTVPRRQAYDNYNRNRLKSAPSSVSEVVVHTETKTSLPGKSNDSAHANCDCGSPLRSTPYLESILETSLELEDSVRLQRRGLLVDNGMNENYSSLRRDYGSEDSIDALKDLVPGSNTSLKKKPKPKEGNQLRTQTLGSPLFSMPPKFDNNSTTLPEKYRPQMIVKPKSRLISNTGSIDRATVVKDRPFSEVEPINKNVEVSLRALDDNVNDDFITKLASYAIGADSMSTITLSNDDGIKLDDSKIDICDSLRKLNISSSIFNSSEDIKNASHSYTTAFALPSSNISTATTSTVLSSYSSSYFSRPQNVVSVPPFSTSVSGNYSAFGKSSEASSTINSSNSKLASNTQGQNKLDSTSTATSDFSSIGLLTKGGRPGSLTVKIPEKLPDSDYKCDSGISSMQTSLLEVGSSVDGPNAAVDEKAVKNNTKLNTPPLNNDTISLINGNELKLPATPSNNDGRSFIGGYELKPASARLIISSPISERAEFMENTHKRLLCSPVSPKDFSLFAAAADANKQGGSENAGEVGATNYPTLSKTLGFPVIIDRKINASNYGRSWYD